MAQRTHSISQDNSEACKNAVLLKISVDWSTTKPIAPFSCTPRVQESCTRGVQEIGLVVLQHTEILSRTAFLHAVLGMYFLEVHTKSEVIHSTPGQLGLGVIFDTRTVRACHFVNNYIIYYLSYTHCTYVHVYFLLSESRARGETQECNGRSHQLLYVCYVSCSVICMQQGCYLNPIHPIAPKCVQELTH